MQKAAGEADSSCCYINILKSYLDIDSAGDGLDNKLCRAVFADRLKLVFTALNGLCGLVYVNLGRSGALAVALEAEVELLSRPVKAV